MISYSALFLTLVVLLVFIIPLVAAFMTSVFAPHVKGHFTENAVSGRIFYVSLYTLKIAVGSTLVAFALGFPAAFFCARRNFFLKKILIGFSAVPLCVPVLIASLGFVSVFGVSGFLNNVLSCLGFEKSRILYSETGIMIAQGAYNFPLVMSIVSKFWEGLPGEPENAARLLGASEKRIFFKITLPSLIPAIGSAVIPVFLFCFFSFMMVLLFSVPGNSTLEVEIYQAIKTNLDYTYASRLALIETSTAILIVILYITLGENRKSSGQLFEKKDLPKIGRAEYESSWGKVSEDFLFIVLFILIVVFFLSPLAGIVINGFTARVSGKNVFSLNQYKMLFNSKGFWMSLLSTVKISFCTAIVCTIVSLVYALSLQNPGFSRFSKVFKLSALFPMAVSSIVLGFGLTLIFKKGSEISLILVQSALFWPLGFRQISSALDTIPVDVKNAASVLSENFTDSAFRIFIPWIKKSVFASFGFCFAFSAGDTTLPLILSVPKFQTLSLYTYRLSGSYRFNTACVSGTVLALICFCVFMISEKIGRRK
ncbi:MAG: iron ABC transporter permease [Treponema sp.]|nr:iron ABC transporter permease [Treponema sp.]